MNMNGSANNSSMWQNNLQTAWYKLFLFAS